MTTSGARHLNDGGLGFNGCNDGSGRNALSRKSSYSYFYGYDGLPMTPEKRALNVHTLLRNVVDLACHAKRMQAQSAVTTYMYGTAIILISNSHEAKSMKDHLRKDHLG